MLSPELRLAHSDLFQPLPLFLAVRYLRVKRKNRFAAFVSLASVAGIALGVAILLIVLSVMNGFERQVAARILGMTSHATLLSRYGLMTDWQTVAARARTAPAVVAAEPFIRGAGMLNHRGKVRGVLLYVIASLSTPANGNPDQIRSAKEVLLTYCDPRQLRDNMAVPRGLCSSQVEQQKKAAAGYLDEAVKTITANSVSVAA